MTSLVSRQLGTYILKKWGRRVFQVVSPTDHFETIKGINLAARLLQ